MRARDIAIAANALGNQVAAGIPMHDAVRRMTRLMKSQAQFWSQVASQIALGKALSSQLAGEWPEGAVNAVRAGEQSGNLAEVMARICETMELQQRVRAVIYRLSYPFGLLLGGFAVFLFFMLTVIPSMARSLGQQVVGGVLGFALMMQSFLVEHWVTIAAILVGGVSALVLWVRNPTNRLLLFRAVNGLPVVGDAIRDMYFGLWAYYLAVLDAAGGIPVRDKLLLAGKVMPLPLQEGVVRMADEVVARGLGDAADPERQQPNDPRLSWPFYIPTAFIVASETGRLDREMLRVAPILMKEGFTKIDRVLGVLNIVALVLAAAMVATPLMLYYVNLAQMLRKAMSS